MMSVQEYLEILRNIRDCAFATVDCTGAPTVRIIDVMLSAAAVHRGRRAVQDCGRALPALRTLF